MLLNGQHHRKVSSSASANMQKRQSEIEIPIEQIDVLKTTQAYDPEGAPDVSAEGVEPSVTLVV